LLGVPTVSTGDRGTKKVPNIGDHALFSIMTTEPNGIVEPIHEKAMPVMLMTPDDVDQWLWGVSVDDALKMRDLGGSEAQATGESLKSRSSRSVYSLGPPQPPGCAC
jgi:putative SOS response-associated peptidase YedK